MARGGSCSRCLSPTTLPPSQNPLITLVITIDTLSICRDHIPTLYATPLNAPKSRHLPVLFLLAQEWILHALENRLMLLLFLRLYAPSLYLSLYLTLHLSLHLSLHFSLYLTLYLSLYLSLHFSLYLSLHL